MHDIETAEGYLNRITGDELSIAGSFTASLALLFRPSAVVIVCRKDDFEELYEQHLAAVAAADDAQDRLSTERGKHKQTRQKLAAARDKGPR